MHANNNAKIPDRLIMVHPDNLLQNRLTSKRVWLAGGGGLMNGRPTSLMGGTCRKKSLSPIFLPSANGGSGLCANLPFWKLLSTSAQALNGPYTSPPSIQGVISFNCNNMTATKTIYNRVRIRHLTPVILVCVCVCVCVMLLLGVRQRLKFNLQSFFIKVVRSFEALIGTVYPFNTRSE